MSFDEGGKIGFLEEDLAADLAVAGANEGDLVVIEVPTQGLGTDFQEASGLGQGEEGFDHFTFLRRRRRQCLCPVSCSARMI